VPLWWFRYFPSQDGGSHVENADIVRRYSNPSSSLLRRYYVLATNRDLNWLGTLILAGLRTVASTSRAISLLVSGYVILLPISFLFALRSINPRAGPWAFLVLPFVYNYPLHMGFFNFAWSLPFFFLLVGWFLRRGRPARSYVGFAALSLVLYFFHPGTWAMAALTIAILAGVDTCSEWIASARAGSLTLASGVRIGWRGIGMPFLALLPALLLMLRFASHAGGVSSVRFVLQSRTAVYAAVLLNEFAFRNALEHRLVQGFAAVLFLCAAGLFLSKLLRSSFSKTDGLLLVSVMFLVLGFFVPDEMLSGQFLAPRLALFMCLTLILWLGSGIRSRSVRDVALAVSAIASVALLAARMPAYGQIDSLVSEYVSASAAVEGNRTLLPLTFLPFGPEVPGHGRIPMNVHIFQHTAGYIASGRNVVDLANYEANTEDFPVEFREPMNPYKKLGDLENNQGRISQVNLSGYGTDGGTVDYVLLWGARAGREAGNTEDAAPILAQLAAGYEKIFVSKPRGLGELYRRKGLRSAPPL
jgi:hypothetical protein